MDINKEWYDKLPRVEGSYRLFFRNCVMCGQPKVTFTQEYLGQTSSPPEGIRTHWGLPKVVLGVKSKAGYLCDSCGHFKERIEELRELEKKIELAEKKIMEYKAVFGT